MKDMYKKKREDGFTIIEVLIVLAIAGLIILIVFLAVPALQRNSRNTQIRNDANTVLGYINEYVSNNNGAMPGYVCTIGTDGSVYIGTGTCPTTAPSTAAGKIRGSVPVSSPASPANPTDVQTIVVGLNRKCNGSTIATSNSTRAVAIGLKTETSGSPTDQCIEG